MQRKLFIAINLDNKSKKYIEKKTFKWHKALSASWGDTEKYHITLLFLGYVDDSNLTEICNNLDSVLENIVTFDFELDSFVWAPKESNPRMIWLTGPINNDLVNLRGKVESAVSDFKLEKKVFKPHLTIARLKSKPTEEVKKDLEIENNEVRVVIPVASIDLMESFSDHGRVKYQLLHSVNLK